MRWKPERILDNFHPWKRARPGSSEASKNRRLFKASQKLPIADNSLFPFQKAAYAERKPQSSNGPVKRCIFLTSNQGNASWRDNWVPFHSENICTSKTKQIIGRAPHWYTPDGFRSGRLLLGSRHSGVGHGRNVPRQVGVTPQGALGSMWARLWFWPLGEGCHWQLVSRGSGTAGNPCPPWDGHSHGWSDPSAQSSLVEEHCSGSPTHTCVKMHWTWT